MVTGGIYLYRRLEQLLPGVVSKPYRKLKLYDGLVVPTIPDLEAGAAEVVREIFSEVGDADFTTDGAVDLPLVDVSADEARYRVVMFASGMPWTLQQMRAMEKAQNANFVNARKQSAAMRSIAERMDKFAAYGNSSMNLSGFFNHPDVDADNLSTNLYTLTPDQLAQFFIQRAAQVAVDSAGTFDAVDVVVSHNIYVLLSSVRMTDSSVSVLNYILANSGEMVASIKWVRQAASDQMAGANAGQPDKDRIVFYPFERVPAEIDPTMELALEAEVLERHVEPPQIAPQDFWEVKGLRQVVPMFACATPTIINYPDALRYADVPKKAI